MERPRAAYRDYYYILGLTAGASERQIQAAYHELYEKFGPHVSAEELDPEAMAKAFRDISEAYQVLMDPLQRADYDKKAYENKQVSNDLRDLWLKKSGLNAAEAAAAQAAEENSPASWIKRTTTGNHPIYEDGPNGQAAQSASSARNQAFNPNASANNQAYDQRTSSARNPAYNQTTSSARNPAFNPTASTNNQVYDQRSSSARNPAYNPNAQSEQSQEYSDQNGQNGGNQNNGSAVQTNAYSGQPNAYVGQPDASGGQSNGAGGRNGASSSGLFEVDLTVTLKEAFKGTTRELVITDPVTCTACSHMKPVLRMQCANCHGVGTYNVDRTEVVNLPSGMYEGMEVLRPEQGRFDLRANRRGDLLVRISLGKHALLNVSGRDLTCTIPVNLYEAMLGAEIEAPCATGKVKLKIQPLTQPGRVYRLKGMGLSGGDQLVTIEVVLPARLSGDEVATYKKLRDSFNEPNPRDKFFQQT